MWIFTPDFFCSVVAKSAPPKDGKKYGRSTVAFAVRFRMRKHAEAFLRFADLEEPIHSSYDTDYRFRVFLSRQQWARIGPKLCAIVTYRNFKDAIKDDRYHDAASKVWVDMLSLQRGET